MKQAKYKSTLVPTNSLTEAPITKEKIYVICECLYYKSGPNSCVDHFSPGTDEEWEFINDTVHEWYQNPHIVCEWNKKRDTVEVMVPDEVSASSNENIATNEVE